MTTYCDGCGKRGSGRDPKTNLCPECQEKRKRGERLDFDDVSKNMVAKKKEGYHICNVCRKYKYTLYSNPHLCNDCAIEMLHPDNRSKNMKKAFPKGDCPKCGRFAMQTQWWTGKKYCPVCDSEKV